MKTTIHYELRDKHYNHLTSQHEYETKEEVEDRLAGLLNSNSRAGEIAKTSKIYKVLRVVAEEPSELTL